MSEPINIVLILLLQLSFLMVSLWLACRLTSVKLKIHESAIVITTYFITSLIPGIGWIISSISLFTLLHIFTSADIWPDLILTTVVTRFLFMLLTLIFSGIQIQLFS